MYQPLPHDLTIKESGIHGLGLFAVEDIPADTNLGITHYWLEGKIVRTPLGGFYNHSEDPNCYSKIVNPDWRVKRACLVTLRDIKAGEEITATYKIQPLS
jgi:SET domain-containing protein